MEDQGAFDILSEDMALKTHSRWYAIYVLLGIYAFWTLLYILLLKLRTRGSRANPSSKIEFQVPVIVNPIHSQEVAEQQAGERNFQSPV